MNGASRILLLLGAALALIWGVPKVISTVRGIRNNNPGNVRLSDVTWQGQVPADQQSDDEFVQFTAPEYGIRAITRILMSYAGRGVNTVREIVSTWAPPDENDTDSYITAVANNIGMSPDAPLATSQWPGLIAALIRHENGIQPYDAATIARGVAMA